MSIVTYRMTDRAEVVQASVTSISYAVYDLTDTELFLMENLLDSGTTSSDVSGIVSVDLGAGVPAGTLVAFIFTKAASFGDTGRESFFGPLVTS